ncbi:MAG: TonB-dependent receptor [Tannerella sp.]|jgi:iron complex outermembrane receptor protein|nr:TonB-dependent receptor [Tannerella sp.]
MKHVKRKFYLLDSFGKMLILSLLMSMNMSAVFAQFTVKGTVKDETGETMIGVNVVEKGTSNGVVTDIDGAYSITVSNGQRAVIQFSFIGYNTLEETVAGRTTVSVALEPSVVNLGEVVAIGYGTQTRREITGSVASVSEESFNQGLVRDAADLLQGKVAGLVITSGSGDVTRGAQIRLRGTSTLQNDQGPFIVLDGIPGSSLDDVPPQDIESISVLKDASAAAIYGSRAAGGVILITTKRGTAMRTQVNYNGYLSFDQVRNKPDMMDADQWRAYAVSAGKEADIPIYDKWGADTDWFDVLMRTGVSHNHALSLSGGGPKSNYRASVTYLDRKGISRDNDMRRLSFRFQFQQRALNDKLRFSLTGSSTLGDMNQPDIDNFVLAYNMLPVYPVYYADGSYFTEKNTEYDQGNPVQNQDLNERRTQDVNFYGVGDIQWTIIQGLNLKGNFYKSRSAREYNEFNHSETRPGMGTNGNARKDATFQNRDVMEWTLEYENMFGNHKIQALLGYSWEKSQRSYLRGQNRNFLVNDLKYNRLESGTGLTNGDVTSSASSQKLISLFARAQYSYLERYMLTATIRRDGSSKFGANHKWGTFPSASAAWGISQESFMKGVNWLNDLKFRVGYGVTGNQDGLAPYRSLELYGTQGIYYDAGSWATAYQINRNANPNLKWESTAQFNIGLDFSILNNRLSGTIEYYEKKTSDMLFNYTVPTPPFVYPNMQANVGDMSNRGLELMINASILRSRNHSWTLTFNAATNRNRITSLSNDIYTTTRVYLGDPWIRGGSNITSHVVEEGRPVGQFFMLKSLGLDANGKYIMQDTNEDGQITEDDRTYVGDAQADVTFGLNNAFTYRQWDFSIFFRGSLGQMALNNPRAAYANSTFLIGANAMNDPLVYELTESPRISSFYLEDASFVKLDNMSLGYTVKVNKTTGIDKLRIYLAAQNLLVITKYSGLDPEMELYRGSASDSNAGLYPGIEPRQYMPRAKTFTVGVSVTF